jgi:hypothetical protein
VPQPGRAYWTQMAIGKQVRRDRNAWMNHTYSRAIHGFSPDRDLHQREVLESPRPQPRGGSTVRSVTLAVTTRAAESPLAGVNRRATAVVRTSDRLGPRRFIGPAYRMQFLIWG